MCRASAVEVLISFSSFCQISYSRKIFNLAWKKWNGTVVGIMALRKKSASCWWACWVNNAWDLGRSQCNVAIKMFTLIVCRLKVGFTQVCTNLHLLFLFSPSKCFLSLFPLLCHWQSTLLDILPLNILGRRTWFTSDGAVSQFILPRYPCAHVHVIAVFSYKVCQICPVYYKTREGTWENINIL